MLPDHVLRANLDAIAEAAPARPRRRRPRVVAAAVPRHGARRAADAADVDRHRRWCSAPRRTSPPARPAGWSGSRPTAARPPPAPTSATCSPPGPSTGLTSSTCPACASRSTAPSRSIPTRSRRSSRPAPATGCARARCSPPSAWPRSPSPARSPSRWAAWSPTASTAGSSRPSATRPRSSRRRRAAAASPFSAAPVPGSRSASSTPRPASPLRDREVGELEIRGTSVTPGYYKRPDANAELFHDGWLRTGDLAYTLDGELVMCGRIKDVIIVGGRNVFPEDVERAVGALEGVRAGNVIAFGVDGDRGRETLVVVGRDQGRRRRGGAPGNPRPGQGGRRRAAQGHRARGARHPAEDQLGQAPAVPLPQPLPRRPARPGRRCRIQAALRRLEVGDHLSH